MKQITLIDSQEVQREYLKDLYRYRELFYFFAWRDILVRYKQAFFGVAWALVRPLLNMVLFTFIFQKVASLPSEQVTYSLFVLAAMLPWQLVSNTMNDTTLSLLNNSNLIIKAYFPRLIIPLAQIVIHLVDFAIGFLMLLALVLWKGEFSLLTFAAFPLLMALTLMLCAGLALWLSALTVQYRDVRFIVPFLVQFGMFISPVGYGSFMIPERWLWLYALNPMVGIIDGFRWAIFGVAQPTLPLSLTFSVAITALLFVSGYRYFLRREISFADRI